MACAARPPRMLRLGGRMLVCGGRMLCFRVLLLLDGEEGGVDDAARPPRPPLFPTPNPQALNSESQIPHPKP